MIKLDPWVVVAFLAPIILFMVGYYLSLSEPLLLCSREPYLPKLTAAIQHNLTCNITNLMYQDDFKSLVNWTVEGMSVANCDFRAITRDFARMAVSKAAPQGLVLMGDSVTRYQYLNLVHFLEHGSWYTDPTGLRPSENERKFDGGWKEFYQVTNERLRGHEICDCYRENDISEFRYYINGDVKVSYLQLFGNNTVIRVHNTSLMNISSCYESPCVQSLCQPGYCAPTLLPIDELGTILQLETFSRLVKPLNASQVFVNLGHWWGATR